MANKIQQVQKEYGDDYFNDNAKNEIYEGLKILAKYCDDIDVNPAHDMLYAGFDGIEDKMTKEDIKGMFELNWMWAEEYEHWSIFT